MNQRKKIKKAVKDFFNGAKYVYATPGTTNHSANFYGDTEICKLCQRDVINSIENAATDWHFDTTDTPQTELEIAIDTVLDDLQYEKPE